MQILLMNELELFFKESHQLSQIDLSFVVDHFDKVSVDKGTILIEPGIVVDFIYFIAEGVLHHFNYNQEGEKITLDLHDGPSFCTDLESFSEGKKSKDYCVALTDITLYVLRKDKYDALISTNVKWSNIAKDIIEKNLIKMLDQLKAVSNKSVEQRYLELVKNKPLIIQSASVIDIASYLGTSRETLHRIRRKNILV